MKEIDYKILEKYKLDPKFGYGGVSELFLIQKINMIKALEDPEYWVSLWELVGCKCGGYNGYLDKLLLDVVADIKKEKESKGIFLYGKEDEEKKAKIEIINYMLCSEDMADYGSSPRFPWLTEYGKVVLDLYDKQKIPKWLDKDDI